MFLKPTPTCILIIAVLLLIAYGGYVQSQAFTETDAGQPALPLAHLFESIPHLWEVWVFLLAPLAIILRVAGVDQLFNTGPMWLFWAFQFLYFYFLYCLIVLSWNRLTRRGIRYAPDSTSS